MDARYISSADGTKVYADAIGDSSNPSIVFIHGFALSASVFDNIFIGKRYADNYYLVCLFALACLEYRLMYSIRCAMT